MKAPQINCVLFHDGRCSHASARNFLGGCKPCILMPFADPRIGGCRVQIVIQRPTVPPPAHP